MTKAILAIDPGAKGFITFYNEVDGFRMFYPIAEGDMLDLARFIQKIREEHPDIHCVMEEVHSVFGSSAKATFSFGEVNGYLKGILTALHIPYTLVQPKIWQKEIWITQDMEYDTKTDKDGNTRRTVNTKKTSYNASRRLFPDVDLRRSPKCVKFDDNKVDSLLLCEYARRRNL